MAKIGSFVMEVIIATTLSLPWCVDSKISLGTNVLTTQNFDEFVRRNKGVLVDFYDPRDEQWSEYKQEVDTAVREARSYGSNAPIARVDVTAEPYLARKFSPSSEFPQLLWFLHGEPTEYHRALRKSKQIVAFILALDREPIQEVDSEEVVRESVNRAVFAEIPHASPMYKVLEIVALKHMASIQFGFTESTKNELKWLEQGKDTVTFAGEATVHSLERWVRRQIMRFQPIPEPQPGDSLTVTGNTFESVVFQPDKDVFLMVYAPWCGHSRKFSPVWETFSRRAANVPNLVVAKIDGDLNMSPDPKAFSWTAFPTVFFFKAGERTPIIFHGNRTVPTLAEFAQPPHGSMSFNLTDEVFPDDQETEL